MCEPQPMGAHGEIWSRNWPGGQVRQPLAVLLLLVRPAAVE